MGSLGKYCKGDRVWKGEVMDHPPGIARGLESLIVLLLGSVAVVGYRLGTGELQRDLRTFFDRDGGRRRRRLRQP